MGVKKADGKPFGYEDFLLAFKDVQEQVDKPAQSTAQAEALLLAWITANNAKFAEAAQPPQETP